MRRFLYSTIALSLLAVGTIGFTGCTEDEDNPITPVDEVVAPTTLRAYSDNSAVGLTWVPSSSETQSNFRRYHIKYIEAGSVDDTLSAFEAEGNGTIISGLTNGIVYYFKVYAEDTDGNLSATAPSINWAPAVRQIEDVYSQVIKVYATTSSTFPSGIDIYNPDGLAEVIKQSDAVFAERGDLYVYAASESSADIEIRCAQNAQNNPGPNTFFSSTYANGEDADNLNEISMSSPPADQTYSLNAVSIGTAQVNQGKMFFGRLTDRNGNETYYFRMLVLRGSNGALVQGTGKDRYVELEFSYQSAEGIQYSKTGK